MSLRADLKRWWYGTGRPELVDHRTPCYLCWYCGQQLPAEFTSVSRGEQLFRVHYDCRPRAAAFLLAPAPATRSTDSSPAEAAPSVGSITHIPKRKLIEDQPDVPSAPPHVDDWMLNQ